MIEKTPGVRPVIPHFSSGPCAKRPGWNLQALTDAALARSHRAKIGKAKLKRAIDLTREVLEIPADYRIGIVPASDTGAVEMALWSLLGARPVTMLVWESFGEGWLTDVEKQLKLKNVTVLKAPYGELPDLRKVDFASDVVFTWNGTTSGVRVPNGDWIAAKREGLTICDATSAAFAQRLDWSKLDVATFSWQKALGGEGAHGMLVLSATRRRAAGNLQARLAAAENLPHDQRRQAQRGHLRRRDHQHAVDAGGGGLSRRARLGEIDRRALRHGRALGRQCQGAVGLGRAHALGREPRARSGAALQHLGLPEGGRSGGDAARRPTIRPPSPRTLAGLLEKEGVAYDIAYYRDAPPGLRIWCGATVEASDVEALTAWLDWAFAQVKAALPKAA